MAAYVFGKDFTFTFYARDGEGAVVAASADAPTIYVYSTEPSREEAANGLGSGLLETVSSWSVSGNGYDVAVTAIADPNPTSDQHTEEYWLAVNFTLDVGGDTSTVIEKILVARPLGYDTELNVASTDLDNYYTAVSSYHTTGELGDIISEATNEVKADIRASGYEWARIKRIDRLRSAVIHKSLYMIALNQISNTVGANNFQVLLDESRINYERAVERLVLEYDANGDGEADNTVSSVGSFAIQVT